MRCWVLLLVLLSWGAQGEDVLRSAVSTNFPDGLHTHYLAYIANKLGVKSEVATMPYARRLLSVDNGTLDIMVGVSNTAPIGENTDRIEPAYESLSVAIFVLAGNESTINSIDSFHQYNISVTRNSSRQTILQHIPDNHIIPAVSLEQKIELLLKGRIDSFMHVKQSTLTTLITQNLYTKIRLADFQPPKEYEQHVVINKNSWLYQRKGDLEQIIRDGVAKGDFAHIRYRFYKSENK